MTLSTRTEGVLRERLVIAGTPRDLVELRETITSALALSVVDGTPCDVSRAVAGTGVVRVEVRE